MTLQSILIAALALVTAPTATHNPKAKIPFNGPSVKSAKPMALPLGKLPSTADVIEHVQDAGLKPNTKAAPLVYTIGPGHSSVSPVGLAVDCASRVDQRRGRASFYAPIAAACRAQHINVEATLTFPLVKNKIYAVDCEASTAIWEMTAIGEGTQRRRRTNTPSLIFIGDRDAYAQSIRIRWDSTADTQAYLGRCQVTVMD